MHPTFKSFRLLSSTLLCSLTMITGSGPVAQAVPTQGHRLMYSGPTPYGVEIARDIQAKGGNAVDAAVAIALSMAVTHPYYAAFGGGGFAMVRMNGKVKALDFRETAPKKSGPQLYDGMNPKASRDGGLAIGVPGVPAGLWALHHEYGKLKWAQLFDDALALATKGFHVSGEFAQNTAHTRPRFNAAGVKIFSSPDAKPLRAGDMLAQPELAKFLALYKADGPSAFYGGDVAKDLLESVQSAPGTKGIITTEDLKSYKVRWLEPIKTSFSGRDIYLMPPPSSGGVVIAEALRMIEKLDLKSRPEFSADEYHLLGEIMKQSYKGRSQLGDPDFTQNPLTSLLEAKTIDRLASEIRLDKSLPVEAPPADDHEKAETTHLNVMTSNGDAVSMTITLNGNYGSAVVSPKFGIALNDEMDDFTTHLGKPNMFGLIQGEANRVRAGARPLSSMSPTLIVHDGQTEFAVGSPGGPRIISGVLQVVYRLVQRGDDVDTAIQSPRVHHQYLPDTLFVDAKRFAPEILANLRSRGHVIEEGSTAKVYAIQLQADGSMAAAYDSRGEGAAGGD